MSSSVLQWIRSRRCRFQTFVVNRVGEILESTSNSQWRHVPDKLLYPADGLPTEHVWFQGPSFSREAEPAWPANIPFHEPNDDDSEVVPMFVGAVLSPQTHLEYELVNFILHRSSSWNRVIRVLTWIRPVFRIYTNHREGIVESFHKQRVLVKKEILVSSLF